MVGAIFENTKLITIGSVATVSGILGLGGLAWWYRQYLKNKPPSKWMKVAEITDLCIYPVKSFKAIRPSSFECTPLGARVDSMRDRSFVVVDTDGKFVTGRDYPKMTQIVPTITGTSVLFSYPDVTEGIEFDLADIQGNPQEVIIWGTVASGIDCGDEVASWLSRYILQEEKGLRLLYCGPEEKGKRVNDRLQDYSKLVDVQLQKNDGGVFSDGVSYHLISEASIRELNSRLEGEPVSASNFRPNFIINGEMLIPFEEDDWKWIKIGEAVFQIIAPCTRCTFTTVNPNTGVKSDKFEPLQSLKRFRQVRDSSKKKLLTSPMMGVYMCLRSGGTVSIGDEVYIPQR